MQNKGMTATFFNWIFVVIAGAIILLFFFKLISVQSSITEKEISTRILKDMEDVIIGKSVSTESSSEIMLSNRKFVFECSEPCNEKMGCNSWMGTANSADIETSTQPLFSVRNLQADKLFAFAFGWNMPFHVGNFLYFAVPKEKIIFPVDCDTNANCNQIYSRIPQKIKDAQIVVKGGVASPSDTFVRNVKFVNAAASCTITNLPNVVCIDTTNSLIFFYDNNVLKNSMYFPNGYPYYGDEIVVGAIFSDNAYTFECNMKKAFYKFNNVLTILKGKSSDFITYYNGDNCANSFSSINAKLNSFSSYANYNPLWQTNDFKILKDELAEINNKLRRDSCSSLY